MEQNILKVNLLNVQEKSMKKEESWLINRDIDMNQQQLQNPIFYYKCDNNMGKFNG